MTGIGDRPHVGCVKDTVRRRKRGASHSHSARVRLQGRTVLWGSEGSGCLLSCEKGQDGGGCESTNTTSLQRARLQVQQQRCEGKAFMGAGTAETEARQLRQQVTHLQEQRTVPLGRAPLVLGCRLAIRPSQPFLPPLCRVRDLVQGPAPRAFEGDSAMEFSPLCLRGLPPGPRSRAGERSVPTVFSHPSLPFPFLWPCWGPRAQR